jgi:tetratricopeptide (TPR) repeat protein
MGYRKLLTLLFISPACIFPSNAQKLDSLLKELDAHIKEDTIRLKLLIETGIAYQGNNPEKGIAISDSAIALANKLHVTVRLADAYHTKAVNQFAKGDFAGALNWFQKALAIYEHENNKKGVANSFNNIAGIYVRWSDYYKALAFYEKALKGYKALNLKNYELKPLLNMAMIYITMSILPKALDYAQKSLLIAESLNDLKSLPACYNTLGDIYSGLSDFNLGRLYHEKAYNISKQIDNKRGMAMALLKIGSDFLKSLTLTRLSSTRKEQWR